MITEFILETSVTLLTTVILPIVSSPDIVENPDIITKVVVLVLIYIPEDLILSKPLPSYLRLVLNNKTSFPVPFNLFDVSSINISPTAGVHELDGLIVKLQVKLVNPVAITLLGFVE